MATDSEFKRGKQPCCAECSHPRSFHGGGTTRCRALGCRCSMWVEPKQEQAPAAATV